MECLQVQIIQIFPFYLCFWGPSAGGIKALLKWSGLKLPGFARPRQCCDVPAFPSMWSRAEFSSDLQALGIGLHAGPQHVNMFHTALVLWETSENTQRTANVPCSAALEVLVKFIYLNTLVLFASSLPTSFRPVQFASAAWHKAPIALHPR